ncbi:MAG: DUF1127 domain-containing protein [Gammaproteobacteria bacterium]|nr:DUF1127 domain-containing protein [Gammaproteobacteria bacterium]
MSTNNVCINQIHVDDAPRNALTSKISNFVEHGVATVHKWNQRSLERRQLSQLDDNLLKDIGISRVDAQFEASKPFWKE